MSRGFEKAIERIGTKVLVEGSEGLVKGIAVLYPIRYRHKQWGNVETAANGRSDPERYIMFCAISLVENSKYGDLVFEGKNKYVIIWKDNYCCRLGDYARVCVRRVKGD